jgi:hypothetical protein
MRHFPQSPFSNYRLKYVEGKANSEKTF